MKQSKMKFKNNKMASANIKVPVNEILILIIHQLKKKQRQKKRKKTYLQKNLSIHS